MSETLGVYNVGISRPQPPPSFEARDMDLAKRYVAQYLSGNRGIRS